MLYHLYSEGTFLRSGRFASEREARTAAAATVAASTRPLRTSDVLADCAIAPAMKAITDSRGRRAPF